MLKYWGLQQSVSYLVWDFVYPSAPGGIGNATVNPLTPAAPSFDGLRCSQIFFCVVSNNKLRDRGVWYFEGVRKSGWHEELELFEEKGEDHVYSSIKRIQ